MIEIFYEVFVLSLNQYLLLCDIVWRQAPACRTTVIICLTELYPDSEEHTAKFEFPVEY